MLESILQFNRSIYTCPSNKTTFPPRSHEAIRDASELNFTSCIDRKSCFAFSESPGLEPKNALRRCTVLHFHKISLKNLIFTNVYT